MTRSMNKVQRTQTLIGTDRRILTITTGTPCLERVGGSVEAAGGYEGPDEAV